MFPRLLGRPSVIPKLLVSVRRQRGSLKVIWFGRFGKTFLLLKEEQSVN